MTTQDVEARKAFFLELVYPGFRWWFIGIPATLLYIASAVCVGWLTHAVNHAKNAEHPSIVMWLHWDIETAKTIADCLVGIWTLGPPVWFFFEYFFWVPYWYRRKRMLPSIEAFKHSQEVARNFWLAGVLVLIALRTGHFPGGE